MINKFLIAFGIYSYFFCSMANTCYRVNSEGIKVFSLLPLFTVGLWGPLKSFYLLAVYNSLYSSLVYMTNTLLSLNNLYGASLFVFYLDKVITQLPSS
jgi:hypothetical protein